MGFAVVMAHCKFGQIFWQQLFILFSADFHQTCRITTELQIRGVIENNLKIIAGLPQSGKNIWKMKFFQVREKSGNFVDGQEYLERTWKVREKQGI